jgi:hypothetical protein
LGLGDVCQMRAVRLFQITLDSEAQDCQEKNRIEKINFVLRYFNASFERLTTSDSAGERARTMGSFLVAKKQTARRWVGGPFALSWYLRLQLIVQLDYILVELRGVEPLAS